MGWMCFGGEWGSKIFITVVIMCSARNKHFINTSSTRLMKDKPESSSGKQSNLFSCSVVNKSIDWSKSMNST